MQGASAARGAAAGVLGVSLAVAACGGSGSDSASGGAASADCAAFADYGTFDGAKVNIYSSIRDTEGERYQEAFKTFEDCTGIDVVWEGSGEFEAQLQVRVDGGNAPDLAPIPQPGLLATLVGKGAVKPASDKVKAAAEANYPADQVAYGTVDGTFYAPPNSANVKSLVWYSPSMFAENGWTVPETWDEMITLTDDIATKFGSDGVKRPWCAGFESGDATGWSGTDWIEDILLRTGGPDVYDQWTTHEIPFNDPQVIAAFDKAGEILKNDKRVNGGYGGVNTIATTAFQDGGLPILDGNCALHRQASFYANNWPEGTKVAEDGDIFAFYLPPIDAAKGKPLLIGGEYVAAFNEKPETQAVQLYMESPEYVNIRAKLGEFTSANKGLDIANVVVAGSEDPNPINVLSVELLQDPDTVSRFDGSDLMPGAVGAGSFWKGMTDWITGKSSKDTADFIEASWPKS